MFLVSEAKKKALTRHYLLTRTCLERELPAPAIAVKTISISATGIYCKECANRKAGCKPMKYIDLQDYIISDINYSLSIINISRTSISQQMYIKTKINRIHLYPYALSSFKLISRHFGYSILS